MCVDECREGLTALAGASKTVDSEGGWRFTKGKLGKLMDALQTLVMGRFEIVRFEDSGYNTRGLASL